MSDLSTDAKMMREQQDKDTPETIEDNEAEARRDRHDADPSSGRDRHQADDGPIADPAKGQDDVLAANREAAGTDGDARASRNEAGPAAQPGRSRA